jgi:hypothetical protein
MMGALVPWSKMPRTYQEVIGIIVGWTGEQDDFGNMGAEWDTMVVMTDDGGLLSRWSGYDLELLDDVIDPFEHYFQTGDRVRFFN